MPGEDVVSSNNQLLIYYLTRNTNDINVTQNNQCQIANISLKRELLKELKSLNRLQQNDDTIRLLRDKKTSMLECREDKGILYIKTKTDESWRLALPRALIDMFITTVHKQFGHAGQYKLFTYLRQYFYWKNMRRDVKNFTRSCDLCQRVKYLNYKMEGSYEFLASERPNELVSVDFYGPIPASVGGVQYIFVIHDVFSKLVTLYPIKRVNTKTCLTKLRDHYFGNIGKPQKILSDNGTQFSSPVWKNTLSSFGVKALFSSIRHPQSNPVERTMRELGRLFRTYCSHKHTSWARHVSLVQDCLNLLVHKSTNAVPYYLHYGRSPQEKLREMFPLLKDKGVERDVQLQIANDNLRRAFEQRGKSQKSCSNVQLSVGDLVLLRVPHLSDALQKQVIKFFHIYEGPFRIVKIVGNNAFSLAAPDDETKIKGTYNRFHLRKYYVIIQSGSL